MLIKILILFSLVGWLVLVLLSLLLLKTKYQEYSQSLFTFSFIPIFNGLIVLTLIGLSLIYSFIVILDNTAFYLIKKIDYLYAIIINKFD